MKIGTSEVLLCCGTCGAALEAYVSFGHRSGELVMVTPCKHCAAQAESIVDDSVGGTDAEDDDYWFSGYATTE